jgi:tape measure domain-containing protein
VARSTVELIVDAARAINPLRRTTAETKKLVEATKKADNNIRKANSTLRATGRAADTASKGVNKLGKAVKGLALGFGIFQTGKFVIFKTAELQRQTRSLEVLTGSLDNAKSIISELQAFGAVTPFTSAELIETAKRLKAFGVETEAVTDITKRLADVAGATGADLGGITLAFGQIQAKGRLQGEELLQLQERGVGLQDQLRKQYGLTADEFQKALEQGRFGADAVRFALVELTEEGGKYADGAIAQSDTLAGKFSTLLDNVGRLATKIGDTLQPILDFVLDTSIAIVDAINKALAGPDYATATARLKTVAEEIKETQTNIKNIEAAGITLTTPGLPIRGIDGQVLPQTTVSPLATEQGILARLQGERTFLEGRIKELEKGFMSVDKPTPKPTKPPALRDPRGGGGGGGAPADPLASLKGQVKQLELRNALAAAGTEQERVQAQLLFDIGELTAIRTEDNAELVDQAIKLTGKLAYQNQQNREAKRIEDERARQAKVLNDLYEQVGNTISTAIVDSLMQAKSATEALSGVLNNVANQLLQLGVNTLLKSTGLGIFSALPGFANGGRPPVGRPSVVGERGPELFVPDRAGTILPNGVGMGSTTITVNVSAGETSADSSNGQGASLGKAIGLAVQLELIKQKRPGGLLATV